MALVLHQHPFASYCQKALIALYELGLPFDRIDEPRRWPGAQRRGRASAAIGTPASRLVEAGIVTR